MTNLGRVARRLLPFLLLLGFVLQSGSSVLHESATYDESYYLGLGRYILSRRNWNLPDTRFHPPLSYVMHSLPLLWVTIPDDVWEEPNGLIRGQRIVALRSDDGILDVCRFALLPFGTLLGWLVFAWARRLYGFGGGIVSLILFSFSPNVIAHAGLITPDVTLSCFLVLSLMLLSRLAPRATTKEAALVGLSIGLMLLSKYTALLLLPILIATDLLYQAVAARASRGEPAVFRRAACHWPIILIVAAVVVWAGYGFQIGLVELKPGWRVPTLAAPYVEGALFQWEQSRLPHNFFLMGQYSQYGWWYYYLVVLAVKIPVGILVLWLGLIGGRRLLGFRFRSEEIYLWLPTILFVLYLSMLSTLHHGDRYLLPVYSLGLILVGQYAEVARTRGVQAVLCLLIGWVVAAGIWIWPHDLAYFNEIAGGPRHGYEWLGDSNVDWGQGLKELKSYMTAHAIPRVQLSYFGTADPRHYGIDYEYLPSPLSPVPRTPPLPPGEQPAAIVAISACHYQGIAFPQHDYYRDLYAYEPNDLVAYSILIFDLRHLIPRRH